MPSPLSSEMVDGLFTRLAVRYGSAWFAKWDGVPMEVVKADWASELAGLGMAALTHGLMNIPEDFPPTASQFKRLCLNRPEPTPPQLPAPKADPGRVAKVMTELRNKLAKRKPLAWAYEMQERERKGERLSASQQLAWRTALAEQADASIGGWFTPIPVECWPEKMRDEAGK